MELCLALNGFRLEAEDENALMAMLALASGEIDGDDFAAWIRKNAAPTSD